jgi:hypothetical protein
MCSHFGRLCRYTCALCKDQIVIPHERWGAVVGETYTRDSVSSNAGTIDGAWGGWIDQSFGGWTNSGVSEIDMADGAWSQNGKRHRSSCSTTGI